MLLESIDYGGGTILPGLRVAKLYDASLYWYGVSSGQRHGLGIIGIGRGGSGYDLLLPSLDWEKDICAYTLGGSYFRDANCPNITIASNGQINLSSGIACFNHNHVVSGFFNNLPLGTYCASTVEYKSKIVGSDYKTTYDSLMHRRAGQDGLTDTDAVLDVWKTYEDFPRPSLFFYDVSNGYFPTYVSLVATRNMWVDDVAWRIDQYDPARPSMRWCDFNFTMASSIPGTGNAPTFYVPSDTGNVFPVPFAIRNIGNMDIGGDTYTLNMINVDFSQNSIISASRYAESLWYKVRRQDETKSGKMYILDEWVTIHKPANA